MIKILSTATINFEDLQFRHCDIIIAQNGTAYLWSVGGLPPEGDLQAILESREAELWREAQVSGKGLDFKTWALDYLNTWRGEQRVKFGLTSTAFQELAYTGKALTAERWLLNQEMPFGLALEAAARGITNEAMAQLVLVQWQAWQAASDQVEAAYWTKKAAILAALNVEEIAEILSSS